MAYNQLCHDYKFNEEQLIPVMPFFEVCSYDKLKDCYAEMNPGTFFICKGGGIPSGCTYWLTVVRTQKHLYVYQNEIIVIVDETGTVTSITRPVEADWKRVVLDIGIENLNMSHYDYLELVIDGFWKLVFGKTPNEMFCGGIIGAHGDKAYGYGSEWERANIPFLRGVLLFLLTYTKELGETPKHESCEWVIQNYQKYLPHIEAAEKLAGMK